MANSFALQLAASGELDGSVPRRSCIRECPACNSKRSGASSPSLIYERDSILLYQCAAQRDNIWAASTIIAAEFSQNGAVRARGGGALFRSLQSHRWVVPIDDTNTYVTLAQSESTDDPEGRSNAKSVGSPSTLRPERAPSRVAAIE